MPIHEVTIAKPLAMGRFEITLEDWDQCYKAGVCERENSWPRSLEKNWHNGIESGKYPQQLIGGGYVRP